MVGSRLFVLALLVAAACAQSTDPQYMFIPDGNGTLHLVDLTLVADEPFFLGSADVTLNLYTQSNPTTAQIIAPNSVPFVFNAGSPTRIVIHGWNSAASHMDAIREAYINTGNNYNVILVDWSGLATSLYTSAKNSAINVGAYVGQVVKELNINLNTLSIIGHSLGAHAAGVAGYYLNSQVAVVVGLDAAAPLFGSESLANRLDSTDARFVQLIHTNGGLLGWEGPIGDADFFPNGGKSQPGCGLDAAGSCSHRRSHEYYAESITSKNFVGRQCSSYKDYTAGYCSGNSKAVMGEWCSTSASGSYYLTTNSDSPYAQG